jgi:hypothetical protein
VVVALSLTNGVTTLWVNPTDQNSPSVTDHNALTGTTNLVNISQFELRESGSSGIVNVSFLKVGTTFDSVFPSLHVSEAGTNAIVNWSDPTLGIQGTTDLLLPFTDIMGAQPPYTNSTVGVPDMFFRFKQ